MRVSPDHTLPSALDPFPFSKTSSYIYTSSPKAPHHVSVPSPSRHMSNENYPAFPHPRSRIPATFPPPLKLFKVMPALSQLCPPTKPIAKNRSSPLFHNPDPRLLRLRQPFLTARLPPRSAQEQTHKRFFLFPLTPCLGSVPGQCACPTSSPFFS